MTRTNFINSTKNLLKATNEYCSKHYRRLDDIVRSMFFLMQDIRTFLAASESEMQDNKNILKPVKQTLAIVDKKIKRLGCGKKPTKGQKALLVLLSLFQYIPGINNDNRDWNFLRQTSDIMLPLVWKKLKQFQPTTGQTSYAKAMLGLVAYDLLRTFDDNPEEFQTEENLCEFSIRMLCNNDCLKEDISTLGVLFLIRSYQHLKRSELEYEDSKNSLNESKKHLTDQQAKEYHIDELLGRMYDQDNKLEYIFYPLATPNPEQKDASLYS